MVLLNFSAPTPMAQMGTAVPECPVEAQLILLFVLSNFIAKVAILLSLAYSVFWVSSWWLTKLFSNAWKMGSSSDLETLILSQRPRLVFKMLLTSSQVASGLRSRKSEIMLERTLCETF